MKTKSTKARAAATGALKRGREELPRVRRQGRRLGGATPRPTAGAEAGRTPCPKGSGQEELPHVRGQGQRPRVPGCDGAGTAEKSYRSPKSEVRGGGREELLPASVGPNLTILVFLAII